MDVIYRYCEKGDGICNEDVVGYNAQYAWVIDGATDVFHKGRLPFENEVNWYVNSLNYELDQFCKMDLSPKNIIHQAIISLYQKLLIICPEINMFPEYELPTFAIAMIRESNGEVDYYLLGDCVLAWRENEKVHVLQNEDINRFSLYNRQQMKLKGLDPRTDMAAQEVYQNTRKRINTADGYYIGSVRGNGVLNGLEGTLKLHAKDRIALFSDGFQDYLNQKPQNLNLFFDLNTLCIEIEKMNEYLSDENKYHCSLRPKQIDDRSILLISL